MTQFLHDLYNAWFFYLTNEGNSAGIVSKLTAIGTGTFGAGVAYVALVLTRRFRL